MPLVDNDTLFTSYKCSCVLTNGIYRFLREEIVYSSPNVYYFAIVQNVILRYVFLSFYAYTLIS
jgi:hypothetical protein